MNFKPWELMDHFGRVWGEEEKRLKIFLDPNIDRFPLGVKDSYRSHYNNKEPMPLGKCDAACVTVPGLLAIGSQGGLIMKKYKIPEVSLESYIIFR